MTAYCVPYFMFCTIVMLITMPKLPSYLLILVLLFSVTARAQAGELSAADRRRALSLFQQGQTLYRKGSYREAIQRYRRSLAILPKRQTLYYMAESFRRLGQIRRSHDLYARYMQMLPPDRRAAFAPKLTRLRREKPCMLSVATLPGGATLELDGQPRGTTPRDGSPLRLQVPGGKHQLRLGLVGHLPAVRVVAAEFGEPQALSFVLKPVARPAPARSPAVPSSRPRTAGPEKPRPPASQHLAREPGAVGSPPRVTTRGGLFVTLQAGPYWADFGDDQLQLQTAAQLGLRLGYLWRFSRLGLELTAGALLQPLADDGADETAMLVSWMGGGGVRLYLQQQLWIGLRMSLGLTTLHGAGTDSVLFQRSLQVDGAFSGLLLRPELALGWRIWRGLTLVLQPLAVDYTPRHEHYGETIQRLLRLSVSLGVGWQW